MSFLCRVGEHNVGCGEVFGSESAFSAHRTGTHDYTYSEGALMDPPREDGRRCLTEREMLTLERRDGALMFGKNKAGAWSVAASLESAERLNEPKARDATEGGYAA